MKDNKINIFSKILGFIQVVIGVIGAILGVLGLVPDEFFTYVVVVFISFTLAVALEQLSIYSIIKEKADYYEVRNKEYNEQKKELEDIRNEYKEYLKEQNAILQKTLESNRSVHKHVK